MDRPLWIWGVFFAAVLALVAFDLGVMHRRHRVIEIKEALFLSLFYFILAMGFDWFVFATLGKQAGYEFFTGYLIEKSLSLDNLFVFLLIFTHFSVPREQQHRVLVWGILGALLLRGIMIGAGAALIVRFEWITYIFGVFLVITGIKLLFAADNEPDLENNIILNFMRRHFRITTDYDSPHFFVIRDGIRWFTPLFLVVVLIEISDVIFATDSIPAIFAVTTDPFIVFTSNIFAILGLRALYFALAAFMHRFEYLKYGLSLILVLIGGKMLVNQYFAEKLIPTELSLGVTVAILALSAGVSLCKTRTRPPGEVIRRGWVPGSARKKPTEQKPE